MPRDPRVQKLQRLRAERVTRAAGAYYGTRATAYGNVRSGPRNRDTGRTLLSLVLFVVIVAVALYLAGQYVARGYRPQAAQAVRTVTVTIPQGESASDLAQLLADKGLVNATAFYWYLRFSGQSYTAGPHTLNTNMSMDEIAKAIGTQPVIPVATVLIYPGWRAEQVAQALADARVASYNDVMTQVKSGVFSYDFLSGRPPGATLEGYLLPDTYQFRQHESAHAALDKILANFDAKIASGVRAQGKKLYGSLYSSIIVASIVQREAGTPTSVGPIASVFNNRLHAPGEAFSRLDADSTIQYAVNHAPNWWAPIKSADLDNPSRYNTRKYPGLPPTPISNPSLATIEATVNPPSTPYFYFWHQNGNHGKSYFCTKEQGSECTNGVLQ